jgi:hypothetical protein
MNTMAQRIVFDTSSVPSSEDAVALMRNRRARTRETATSPRLVQRADLERLRGRLAEPCPLEERDLLTLLAYASSGDGDPIIGLLDDVRATLATLGESTAPDPNVLTTLERRVAVAIELYTRATATADR